MEGSSKDEKSTFPIINGFDDLRDPNYFVLSACISTQKLVAKFMNTTNEYIEKADVILITAETSAEATFTECSNLLALARD